jgi:hypothetical protein
MAKRRSVAASTAAQAPLSSALEGEVRERFYERYRDTLRRLAETAPAGLLVRALGAEAEVSGLADALAASVEIPPAHDPLASARARAAGIKSRLLEDAGGAIEVGEVAELLAITPQAVHQRRHRGTLLALQRPNGQWVYPRFQFEPLEIANRIGVVLAAFRVVEPWTRLSVLLTSAPSLGGQRPIDALREGDLEGAIEAVASYGIEAA